MAEIVYKKLDDLLFKPFVAVFGALFKGDWWKDRRGKKALRIPIFLKFAALSALLIVVVAAGLSIFIFKSQKSQYMDQVLHLGATMTRIIANNASDKLLSEEQLSLFQLVLDVAADDQVIDAVITDQDNLIRAHSRLEDINRAYSAPRGRVRFKVLDDINVSVYRQGGEEKLFFEKTISFQKVAIGKVYLTVSQKRIRQNLRTAEIHILLVTLVIVLFSTPLSLGFSIYFSRPIKDLQESAQALGMGDLESRVTINRNDTLGDLGLAFNQMAADLAMKEKIKDSFGKYVTPEIVELILADPEAQWVQTSRREATVLFVDIRGFTALAEEKGPERIVEMLNAHFSRITDIIIKNGGHLNKFIGDEAMAVFGVPRPCLDHATTAIKTALAVQKACAEECARRHGDGVIQVGIGINTGFVVAGNVGSEKRMEYTIIGDEVNVASRLTALAKAGEILITRQTFDRIEHKEWLRAERRGDVLIKGKRKRVTIFNVLDFPDEGRKAGIVNNA